MSLPNYDADLSPDLKLNASLPVPLDPPIYHLSGVKKISIQVYPETLDTLTHALHHHKHHKALRRSSLRLCAPLRVYGHEYHRHERQKWHAQVSWIME